MCFAPQRRALFRHLNLQKWSEPLVFLTFWLRNVLRAKTACTFPIKKWSERGVLCTFWLRNVLRATTACTFSTSQLPRPGVLCAFWLGNVLRATTACNFSSLIWRASSAPAALASLLFDPPEPQIFSTLRSHWIATFLPFRASYSFSSTLISSNLSLLSASSLLCFSSVHIVGSLTSKLPSMMFLWFFYGITMEFFMGFLCGSYAISMLYLWSFYEISVGFLWDFHDQRKLGGNTSELRTNSETWNDEGWYVI